MWHALAATHKRVQTVSGPPQSPIRSLEVSLSQTDLLTPWHDGRAEIIPFRYTEEEGEEEEEQSE